MQWVLWGSIILAIFTVFTTWILMTDSVILDVNNQVNNIWASYVAEASIEKELLNIKSQDIDRVNTLSNRLSTWVKEDMQYWFVHEWADSGYFDLTVKNTPSYDIDLWSIESWDLSFQNIPIVDLFDTFILNYNKSNNKQILVEIIRYNKNWSFSSCDVYGNIDGNCSYVQKTVINTSDSLQNGVVLNWYQILFQSGDNPFSNKVVVHWFNPNSYNYKITFNTLKWWNTEFQYYVTGGWNKKQVVNNFIEIDTIWTAIDSFARMKLTKKVSDDIKPMSKYVLFSDSEIIK